MPSALPSTTAAPPRRRHRLAAAAVVAAAASVGVAGLAAADTAATGPGGRIPAAGPAGNGPASIYPSTVEIAGEAGVVQQVTVVLHDLDHEWPGDLDILLVGPTGAHSLVLSDAGTSYDGVDLDVRITGGHPEAPATEPLGPGPYGPTDHGPSADDSFEAPAPAGPYGADFSVFDGIDPNGPWSLYVRDDLGSDGGAFAGWSLELVTGAVDPCDGVEAPAFADVPAANVHGANIGCLAGYGITTGGPGGRPANEYGPGLPTPRDQMASFVARVADAMGVAMPGSPPDAFADDGTSVHAPRIDQLAALGVIGGNGEVGSSYFPTRTITRGEMASYLNGLVEAVTGHRLVGAGDAFVDDGASPYAADIDALAAAGIVRGTGNGRYGPDGEVRRDSMASFLVNTIRHLAGVRPA